MLASYACGSSDETVPPQGNAGSAGADGGSTGGSAGAGGKAGSGGQAGAAGGQAGSSGKGGTGGQAAGAGGQAGSGGQAGGGAGQAGAAGTPLLAGVNLSCAEFAAGKIPGSYGTDYIYPSADEVDYFVGKGMNTFRLPFLWERLQPASPGPLDATEETRLSTIVSHALGKGAYVILDPHNYARYYGTVMGEGNAIAALADLWSRLAGKYKAEPHVLFGLMNEPNGLATETWRDAANASIKAIRDAGASNLILVPGNAWTGAHSWSSDWYGTANAVAMLDIVDPGNNYVFEVHQYLDSDSSGTSDQCVSTTIGSERLQGFTDWARTHGKQAFLGEFAGARNDTCYQAVDDMLSYFDQNRDVWMGWTWWAAGPWWGDYMFTLEPDNGADRPQMAILAPHLQ
ncbi:MAG: glycoside hydrolase family 5 protein [Deltaproteobacteria bacterium]|nr:glycoside hydrolase family 5 protein [Deltaproteobacteria bacterium]